MMKQSTLIKEVAPNTNIVTDDFYLSREQFRNVNYEYDLFDRCTNAYEMVHYDDGHNKIIIHAAMAGAEFVTYGYEVQQGVTGMSSPVKFIDGKFHTHQEATVYILEFIAKRKIFNKQQNIQKLIEDTLQRLQEYVTVPVPPTPTIQHSTSNIQNYINLGYRKNYQLKQKTARQLKKLMQLPDVERGHLLNAICKQFNLKHANQTSLEL